MADTNTVNLGLLIPDLNDVVSFGTQVEANFTTIDALMGAVQCTSTTRPTNTYAGQIIYETDSKRYVQNTGTKAAPTWTYMSHMGLPVLSSALPTVGLAAGTLAYLTDIGAVAYYSGGAWHTCTLIVCTSGTRPSGSSLQIGTAIYETDTKRALIYNGSSWENKAFANYVCTSSTHPSSPFQGQEIYETDTGLGAVYSGSSYQYGVQQVAPTQILGSSAATVTFSGIPAVNAVKVRWSARGTAAATGQQIYVQLNGDTGSNYHWEVNQANGTSNAGTNGTSVAQIQVGTMIAASSTANYWSSGEFTVDGIGQTSRYPTVQGTACGFAAAAAASMWAGVYSGIHLATGATTSITILPASGSFAAGSQFSIYALQ